jgi:outer membrane protein
MRRIAIAVLIGAALAPVAGQAQEGAIGFVDYDRVIAESRVGQHNRQELESEAQKAGAELARMNEEARKLQDDLNRNAVTMSESEKLRHERDLRALGERFEQRKAEYAEDFEHHRNEVVGAMLQKIRESAGKIAQAENLDLVVNRAVAVSPRVDITAKVVRALDEAEPAK